MVLRLETWTRLSIFKLYTFRQKSRGGCLTLEGELLNFEALVGALLGGNNRSVADQRVVNTREWNQVGLKLVQVDVEGAVKSQGRSNGADHLGNQVVEVVKRGAGNVEVSSADFIDSFVIHQKGAVGVLNGAVSRQDRVVGLDNSGGSARSRVDGELELGLLAIVGSKTLQQKRAKARSSTASKRVENEETLERVAVVCSVPR